MDIKLTADQQEQIKAQGVVEAGQFVCMSMDVFRGMCGIATDADYADSVKKVNEGIAEIRAGKGIPANQFTSEFNRKHAELIDYR